MDHTAGIIETDTSLIPSLLKVFAMFQIRLFYYKNNEEDNFVEAISIKCNNCDRSTGLTLTYPYILNFTELCLIILLEMI